MTFYWGNSRNLIISVLSCLNMSHCTSSCISTFMLGRVLDPIKLIEPLISHCPASHMLVLCHEISRNRPLRKVNCLWGHGKFLPFVTLGWEQKDRCSEKVVFFWPVWSLLVHENCRNFIASAPWPQGKSGPLKNNFLFSVGRNFLHYPKVNLNAFLYRALSSPV